MIISIDVDIPIHDIDGRTEGAVRASLCRYIDRLTSERVDNLDDILQAVMEAKGLA